MVAGATISTELSDAEWWDALRGIGNEHGGFSNLGRHHAAVFVEQSHKVLFVGFETAFGIRSGSETGLPIAFDISERRNWSHLTILTKSQNWFRDENLFRFFDRLVDHAFFDQFDRVVFYGAGMCGYAAAAFSVASPGASVLLVSPQASLDRKVAGWDTRFPSARRIDFGSRYANAPRLLDAAETALLVFDPDEVEDAMHASLFNGDNVIHQRYRRGGAGAIEADLRNMSLISKLTDTASRDRLTPGEAARILRARRSHVPYLRALLSRVLAEDRPALTAQLCRAVLAEQPLPRFRQHLERAEAQLGLRPADPDTAAAARRDEA